MKILGLIFLILCTTAANAHYDVQVIEGKAGSMNLLITGGDGVEGSTAPYAWKENFIDAEEKSFNHTVEMTEDGAIITYQSKPKDAEIWRWASVMLVFRDGNVFVAGYSSGQISPGSKQTSCLVYYKGIKDSYSGSSFIEETHIFLNNREEEVRLSDFQPPEHVVCRRKVGN